MGTRYESTANFGATTPEEIAKRLHTSGRLKDIKQNAPYDAAAALANKAHLSPAMTDLGMGVLSTVGAGLFANRIVGNPIGKARKWSDNKLFGQNSKSTQNSLNGSEYYSQHDQNGQSDNSVKNHNKSFSPDMQKYNQKIKNSEALFEEEGVNRETLGRKKEQNTVVKLLSKFLNDILIPTAIPIKLENDIMNLRNIDFL